jgi:hypothetical protein
MKLFTRLTSKIILCLTSSLLMTSDAKNLIRREIVDVKVEGVSFQFEIDIYIGTPSKKHSGSDQCKGDDKSNCLTTSSEGSKMEYCVVDGESCDTQWTALT